ncbi:hypothetical protein AB0N99_30700 [Streptomyces sp. NPDC093272]|uniref:hypothetical protein n=1 Tax=Streptomyces sp. NPDC093272 TaxID=3154981 RepID=UPI00343DE3AD
MSADLDRLTAAQAAADAVIAGLPVHDGGPLLQVAVTDMETRTRLATGFVTYETPKPRLRLVGSAEHERPKEPLPTRPRGPHPQAVS